MVQMTSLVAMKDMHFDVQELLHIKREQLLPLLRDPYRLNQYAESIIQAQAVLLNGVDPILTQQLSQSIEQLIVALSDSKKYLKPRRFNRLQKWLGLDLDYGSSQVEYYKNLEKKLEQTNLLSRKLQIEMQKTQSRLTQAIGIRQQMAKYIHAAEEFLHEYPNFVQSQHPLDQFSERLSKKINSLYTLQSSNDIAMTQMQLSQQLSYSLLDRFKEAQQVLIPAWQYHVKQSQSKNSTSDLEKLDNSRENLIKTLKKSLERPSKT